MPYLLKFNGNPGKKTMVKNSYDFLQKAPTYLAGSRVCLC